MKPAIRVDNLSKRYRLGSRSTSSYRALRDTLTESAAGAWHGLRRRFDGGRESLRQLFFGVGGVTFRA